MPLSTWFVATTPEGYNAWADLNTAGGLTLDRAINLDLRTGPQVYIALVEGQPTAGVPVQILNTARATLTSNVSVANGFVYLTPVTTGATTLRLGPWPGYQSTDIPVTVVDTRLTNTGELTISPLTTLNLDLMFTGLTFYATYEGKPIAGVEVVAGNGNVECVDRLTGNDGGFRIEPIAVGAVTVTLLLEPGKTYYLREQDGELHEATGLTASAAIQITVISSTPQAFITGYRLDPSTPLTNIPIGSAPRTFRLLTNQLNPLPTSYTVEADVSYPGYISLGSDSRGGTFRLHPRGVGEGKISFSMIDPERKIILFHERRFTVIPPT